MKKKVIKDYYNLPEDLREELKEKFPEGFGNHMITFYDRNKHLISALPFETEDVSYLIKMPSSLNTDEDKESPDPIEIIPEGESIDNLDEEKFLVQEEEEESD